MQLSLRAKAPFRLMIFAMLALFLAESLVMLLFSLLPPMPLFLQSLLDSLSLIVVALPILYFLLFRPLVNHIAEPRRVEEALRESESHFRLLYERLPVPYQSLDSGGHIIDVNNAWLDCLGYKREEVVGRWFGSFLSPGMADLFVERFPCFKAAGDIHGAEFDMVRKDGTIATATFEGRIGHDDQGGFKQTHCVFTDITERKRTGAQIRKLSLAVEQSPASVVITDPKGTIEYVNPKFTQLTGYTFEEAIRKNPRILKSGATPPEEYKRLWQTITAGGEWRGEFLNRKKNGEMYWEAASISPITDDAGRITHFVAVKEDITGRKNAEKALWEEKNKTEAIIAAMGEGISMQDTDYKIMYQNQVQKNIMGEHIGEYCYKAYENRDCVCDGCPVAMAFSDSGIHIAERTVSLGGNQVRFEIIASPLKDATGRIIAGIEIVRDITERKRAERYLRKEGDRTRFLLDLYMHALQMKDAELYGYVLDEAVRLTDSTIGFLHRVTDDQKHIVLMTWNPEARKNCTVAFDNHYPLDMSGNWADCVRLRRPVVYNDFVRSPNQKGLPEGHTPVVRFMSIPVVESDKVRIIFGVGNKTEEYEARDVDNLQLVANELQKFLVHRGAEEKLREREEVLSAIFAQAADGIVLIDAETLRFVEFNVAAHRGLGYSREEFAAMTLPDIQAEETREEVLGHVQRVLESGEGLDFEHAHRHKSGDVRNVYVSNRIVRFRGREYFVGIWHDITREKQGEREKKKLENQLLQSQKMEAIGKLAGGVAHDFNNILTGIIGYASIGSLKAGRDTVVKPYLDEIVALSDRAAHLTHSLLAFSRRQVLDPRPVNINDLVSGMQKLLARIIGEDIEFRVDTATVDLIVTADKGQIELALMNLAINARDAMPHGGKLTLAAERLEIDDHFIQSHHSGEAGAYACVSVADTGVGMEEEVREHMFEPFFTTKDAGKGTGLGLSMVYGTVRQHEGFIDVSSEPGHGTVVKVYLPLVQAVSQPADNREPFPLSAGKETILLIEDDVIVRTVTTSLLEECGYSVMQEADGDSAIALFRGNRDSIDLVISDIIMPGKSGMDIRDALMKISPRVKVLFMSGYTADILTQRGIVNEGINFISKPLIPEVFARKIREVLDK